jgi:UDP-N-acetyl-D-galactosamine dehydrogenase
VKTITKKGINVNDSHVLMHDITFKENTPNVRKTKIVYVVRTFQDYGVNVFVYDPRTNLEEVYYECGITLLNDFEAVKIGYSPPLPL